MSCFWRLKSGAAPVRRGVTKLRIKSATEYTENTDMKNQRLPRRCAPGNRLALHTCNFQCFQCIPWRS